MINRIAFMRNKQLLLGFSLIIGLFSSCQKDILEGQPEWLGNSIYERLEEGIMVNDTLMTFNTTIKMIDELGMKEVLSKTGSKTLFVASDKAYERWFASKNEWDVHSYDNLSLVQKNLLLNNAMIDNAYLLELMSNVAGNPPQQGLCMRRQTAVSIFDSIPEMEVQDMPVNPLGSESRDSWASLRNNNKKIRIFKDDTPAPMIHFLPEFMSKNNITSNDLYVLSNHESTSITDSWINGRKVVSSEQTCKNGYIYVVDGVIESNKNMAEIIHNNENTTQWSHLLMRFAIPYYESSVQSNFRRLYNTNDTVYTLRYLNSENTHGLYETPSGAAIRVGTLRFDPGWNRYIYTNSMNYTMQYDAGAMIVPTDEALKEWWEHGPGEALYEEYGSWDNVPYGTVAELLNVNMLKSFVDAVPSKFKSVLDDAKVELGITDKDIVKTYMGCNGVVYLTDKVFGPSSFRSVIYPALAHQNSTFSVIYRAIVDMDFKPYLNSMDSKFSLLLPYNTTPSYDGKFETFRYIDPCSYGQDSLVMFEFYKDEENDILAAKRYECVFDDAGQIIVGKSLPDANLSIINNRLEYLINNSIIVGQIWEDASREYYKTKGGSVIRVINGSDEVNVRFQGGLQTDLGLESKVEKTYNMLNSASSNGTQSSGNGKTYAISPETLTPLTATKSVYQILEDHAAAGKDSLFYKLLMEDESEEKNDKPFLISKSGDYYCADYGHNNKNVRLFDNYNYTVYVPTDASIANLFEGENAVLPTWEDYNTYKMKAEQGDKEATTACTEIVAIIHDFVRYHFQDNSIYINSVSGTDNYESAKINPQNKRFYSMEVSVSNNSLSVKDYLTKTEEIETGKTMECNSHVLTGKENIWNKTCCEYWISGAPSSNSRTIFSTSHVVVHQIDAPLFFSKDQKVSWRKRVQDAIDAASVKK